MIYLIFSTSKDRALKYLAAIHRSYINFVVIIVSIVFIYTNNFLHYKKYKKHLI